MIISIMILSHFTDKPLIFKPSELYKQDGFFKPVGFWLSDESTYGWKYWCKQEKFRVHCLVVENLFKCDTSKWLLLDSPDKVIAFGKKYGTKIFMTSMIDWSRVVQDYSGILITPYHWELRHNTSVLWYNTWDCSSGCVWDLSTITQIK